MPKLREIIGWLGELTYPRTCHACDRVLSPEFQDYCPDCLQKLLAATSPPYCPRCGVTAEPYLINETGCRQCRRDSQKIDGLTRAGTYDSLVGDLVKRYKFGRRQRMDRLLGSMLADAIAGQAWFARLDGLVPVPASLSERLNYRFFPVGLLAKAAGRKLDLPVLPIVRIRGKKRRQVGLPASARAKNIKGVFSINPRARLEGARLCVIDDVATSNATVNEMAAVLKQAGAAKVHAAVVAKQSALPPDPG